MGIGRTGVSPLGSVAGERTNLSFLPIYSGIASELNKMTQKDFCWKRESWAYDYEEDFHKMKKALLESVANHFPDYNLDWVLRVDASDKSVGAVLYQERPDEFGVVHESIGFASQTFSSISFHWDAFEKESQFSWRQTTGICFG